MPLQVPGKRSLIEHRRNGRAACSKRHSPPCNRPTAECGPDRGSSATNAGHEGVRTPGISLIDIPGAVRVTTSDHIAPAGRCERLEPQTRWVRLIETRHVRMLAATGSSRHADEAEMRAITVLDP